MICPYCSVAKINGGCECAQPSDSRAMPIYRCWCLEKRGDKWVAHAGPPIFKTRDGAIRFGDLYMRHDPARRSYEIEQDHVPA